MTDVRGRSARRDGDADRLLGRPRGAGDAGADDDPRLAALALLRRVRGALRVERCLLEAHLVGEGLDLDLLRRARVPLPP